MIHYRTETREVKIADKIECDVCNKLYEDPMEVQEFHNIKFMGGYSSIFGDMYEIECHICQHCLMGMIGDYYRIVN